MDDRDLLREERLDRTDTFGTDNLTDWPAGSFVATHFANIHRILENLTEAKLKQLRLPVGKSTLLDALWLDFKNIARTARAIALTELGFSAPYILPPDATEHAIKLHADALLKLLEDNNAPVADGGDTPAQKTAKAALRQRFINYFLPADFVQDLRTDLDALAAKNVAKITDNNEGNEGTGEIEALLAEGALEVIPIDAALQNLYARNPGKLRAWLAASRVERSPKKKKKDDGTGGTTPGANP